MKYTTTVTSWTATCCAELSKKSRESHENFREIPLTDLMVVLALPVDLDVCEQLLLPADDGLHVPHPRGEVLLLAAELVLQVADPVPGHRVLCNQAHNECKEIIMRGSTF